MPTSPPQAAASRRAGLTQLEVAFSVAVLLVGLLAFSRTIAAARALDESSHEATLALQAAQRMVGTLQAEDLSEVFEDHGSLSAGSSFEVAGLDPREDDDDGSVGELVFPESPAGVLREDLDLPGFGLPLDLDGDGALDSDDHAGDYVLLPVLVRLRWRGRAGPGRLELRILLGER